MEWTKLNVTLTLNEILKEEIGMSTENRTKFFDEDVSLGDLGLCFEITEVIDAYMEAEFPNNYLGIMPKDTWSTIVKYHDL